MFGKSLYTIKVIAKINTKQFFRDKLAMFFTIVFPLIFLFIFGSLNSGDNNVSFRVAVVNQSQSEFSKSYQNQIAQDKVFDVDKEINDLDKAKEWMSRGELDAAIVLPGDFGEVKDGQQTPSGQLRVVYTQNNQQAGQTLGSILEAQLNEVNSSLVETQTPFTVATEQTNEKGLRAFDYTFAGLLGFAIITLGVFAPVNVFPELKKQGILRRLHTTPLKVWQYFVANVISQTIIGLLALAILFITAIVVFDLQVVGNVFELAIFLALSIISILGIGLAIGGWAKNERQAAPLSNAIVFPMIFLSGSFFPRFLMPEWLQNISAFLPLTPVIDGVRLITTEGQHLIDIYSQVGLILFWMVVVYFIAFKVFRWE